VDRQLPAMPARLQGRQPWPAVFGDRRDARTWDPDSGSAAAPRGPAVPVASRGRAGCASPRSTSPPEATRCISWPPPGAAARLSWTLPSLNRRGSAQPPDPWSGL